MLKDYIYWFPSELSRTQCTTRGQDFYIFHGLQSFMWMDQLFSTSISILVLVGRDFCESVLNQMKHEKYAYIFFLILEIESVPWWDSSSPHPTGNYYCSYTSGFSFQVPKVHGMIWFSGENIIIIQESSISFLFNGCKIGPMEDRVIQHLKESSKKTAYVKNSFPNQNLFSLLLTSFFPPLKPLKWGTGTRRPIQNQYSWTNLSTIIYIDQPVGAGFSQGTPSIKNEEDLSAQLAGFLEQFLDVFEELKGKKFYISGESVRPFLPVECLFFTMNWSMQELIYLVS